MTYAFHRLTFHTRGHTEIQAKAAHAFAQAQFDYDDPDARYCYDPVAPFNPFKLELLAVGSWEALDKVGLQLTQIAKPDDFEAAMTRYLDKVRFGSKPLNAQERQKARELITSLGWRFLTGDVFTRSTHCALKFSFVNPVGDVESSALCMFLMSMHREGTVHLHAAKDGVTDLIHIIRPDGLDDVMNAVNTRMWTLPPDVLTQKVPQLARAMEQLRNDTGLTYADAMENIISETYPPVEL